MATRDELRQQYKERTVTGGIYRILNRSTGRFYLQSTDDIKSAHNLLSFSRATGNCMINTNPLMQQDWKECGADAFEIEELELLEKKPEQSLREFQDDLGVLLEYWDERLPREGRY